MDREELFERVPVRNAILKLTLPMVFGSLVSILYNIADTYFVGQLNNAIQNAAVTFVAPAMTLFYAITNLFGVGASSIMSRALGRKDVERVKKASATGIYLALAFAILLAVGATVLNDGVLNLLGTTEEAWSVTKAYMKWTVCLGAVPAIMNIVMGFILRAEGRSIIASVGMMCGCFINIILDPFFILPFGFNLGAEGAALATFISNCIGSTVFIVYIITQRRNLLVSVNPRYISFKRDVFGEIIFVGFPGVVQNNLNVISMTIMNNLMSAYTEDAVAAMGIAGKVNQLPIQVIFGFSQGVMPLIGYNYASGNNKRMKEAISKTLKISISVLVVITIAFIFGGEYITHIFMKNDNISHIGGLFLRGFGISLIFMCIDFMAVGVSQSFGMGRYALIFSILRKAVLEIPLMLAYNYLFGLNGIAFCQCTAEIVMSIAGFIVLKKLIKDAEKRPADMLLHKEEKGVE